VTVALTAQL